METKYLVLPSQDTINEIYKKLGTSEDKVNSDVKIIKDWMRKQPHLPVTEDDERKIHLFLVFCKNSMERTKELIDQHYAIKSMVPEFFKNCDPTSPDLIKMSKLSLFIPLPLPTKNGHRVSICYINNPNEYDCLNFAKTTLMNIDIKLSKLDFFEKDVLIIDLQNMTMPMMTSFIPYTKKFITCSTKAYPMRIEAVHFFNMPSFAQPIINLVKTVLSSKISNRFIFHKSIDDLKKIIGPEILPLDFGGTYPKTSIELGEEWMRELAKYKDWFLSQESIVSDEKKRLKKSTINIDLQDSVEGSFRKLNVD